MLAAGRRGSSSMQVSERGGGGGSRSVVCALARKDRRLRHRCLDGGAQQREAAAAAAFVPGSHGHAAAGCSAAPLVRFRRGGGHRQCPLPPPHAPRAAPYQPLAAGGQYSYVPVSSFANNIGQLMAVRCLGSQQPGSLCVYNGYDEPAPMSAGRRQLAARAATAAGAAAAACMLLML